jgi:hypothetical protein
MSYFYLAVRIYPVWALPMVIALFELGIYYRRFKSNKQFVFWGLSVLLVGLAILWAYYRGDIYSDRWVNNFLGR